jgi:cysteine desulfurase
VRRIYLDHGATTPVRPEVVEAMRPFFGDEFGNPSSAHAFAEAPREAVAAARGKVAAVLGVDPSGVIFTAGGTESDNLAVLGVVRASKKAAPHVITSTVEHKAVLQSCAHLEKREGARVTRLPVDGAGLVSPDDLRRALTPETVLVQNLADLTAVTREAGVPFHTDAVQSFAKIPTRPDSLGVDLLSASAHKIYGPKGCGFLWVRKGLRIEPIIHGGSHEKGKRAGTENVPGIVGLGLAAELAEAESVAEASRLDGLRTRLWEGLFAAMTGVRLNGHSTFRLPQVASITFEGIEGEGMLLSLDMMGVAVSTGSACMSETLEPSHVLMAMGLDHALAQGTLRFSLGRDNTAEDIDTVIGILPGIVERLRRMSPLV